MANIFSSEITQQIESLQYAIINKQNYYYISGILTEDEIKKIILLLQYEYPLTYQIFPKVIQLQSNNTINLEYNDFSEIVFYEKLNEIQIEIQKKLNSCFDEYEIVKTVYDYITTNMEYDHDALNGSLEYNNLLKEYNESNNSPILQNRLLRKVQEINQLYGASHCIYGPVVNKKGVCSGLSQLFKFLLNSFNIEAECILGNLIDVGEHAVVAVKINGEWGIIDIANGMKNASSLNATLYHFFMISMEEYSKQFTPLYEEYSVINTTNNLNFYKKYQLEFSDINSLRAFFSNLIGYKKENIIYCSYIGDALNNDQILKMGRQIIYSKLNKKFEIGEYVVFNKKLSMKIKPRKR